MNKTPFSKLTNWLVIPSLALVVAVPSSPGQSGTAATWNGLVDTNWNTPGNWDPSGVPTGVAAGVLNGTTATITSTVPSVTQLLVNGLSTVLIGAGGSLTGAGAGGNSGLYVGANGSAGSMTVQNGGSFTLSGGDFGVGRGVGDSTLTLQAGGTISVTTVNEFHIGWDGGGVGTINQTGGTFNKTAGGDTRIGAFGGTGTYSISGGTANLNNLRIGFSGGSVGIITQTGGILNHTGELALGWGDGAGTYNMSAGTVVTSQRIRFGIGSAVRNNTFNQTGGSVTVTDGRVDLGEDAGPTNTYNISAGTLAVNGDGRILVGAFNASSGTLNVSGTGVVNAANQITLGDGGSATGTVNLNGGNVIVNRIQSGNSTASQTLNLNGGKITGKIDDGNFIADGGNASSGALVVNLQSAGVTIDSAGHDIGIQAAISGIGSFTKVGANQLKLGAANTYTGNSIVNEGNFTIEGGGSLTFDINASGVNNRITGNGTGNLLVLGHFSFDLNDASAVGAWTIVDYSGLATVTFSDTFSVTGWTDAGSNTWTFGNYTFNEVTGILTAVPEPGTGGIVLGVGSMMMAVARRRRCRN